MSNSRPLAACSVMSETLRRRRCLLGIHDQGDVLEEALQVLELVHEAHELLQVLQPRLRLRALVALPHRRVAGLVQDQLGQLGVRHAVDAAAPALEAGDEVGERLARLAGFSSSVSTISRAA